MIKEFRTRTKMTQRELGRRVGLSQSAVSIFERLEEEMQGRWYDLTEGHIRLQNYIVSIERHKRMHDMYKKVQKTCDNQPELDLPAPTLPEKKERSILSILFGWFKGLFTK